LEHVEAQELFSEYLDGELAPAARADFEAHLQTCAECRKDLESLRATLRCLTRLAPAEPPPDFLDQVRRKIRRHSSGLPFDLSLGMNRKLPFEAISMVLIAILFALYLMLVVLPKERVADPPGHHRPKLLHPDGGVPDGGARAPRER
jgi:anti-sigma factor RsiW